MRKTKKRKNFADESNSLSLPEGGSGSAKKSGGAFISLGPVNVARLQAANLITVYAYNPSEETKKQIEKLQAVAARSMKSKRNTFRTIKEILSELNETYKCQAELSLDLSIRVYRWMPNDMVVKLFRFVITPLGHLICGSNEVDELCSHGAMAGENAPIVAAGEFGFYYDAEKQGFCLGYVSNRTGHYRIPPETLTEVVYPYLIDIEGYSVEEIRQLYQGTHVGNTVNDSKVGDSFVYQPSVFKEYSVEWQRPVEYRASDSNYYIRRDVPAGRACAYTAMGISRDLAKHALLNHRLIISGLIKAPVRDALLSKDFHDYYVRMFGVVLPSLEVALSEKKDEVLTAYINYDVRDGEIGEGFCHPAILQALAEIYGYELRIWMLGDDNNTLIPYNSSKGNYGHYKPEIVEGKRNLLFVKADHIERLEWVEPTSSPGRDTSRYTDKPCNGVFCSRFNLFAEYSEVSMTLSFTLGNNS